MDAAAKSPHTSDSADLVSMRAVDRVAAVLHSFSMARPTAVPLNMAAGPRVVLAYMDGAAREVWLARPQPSQTRHTQTDRTELRRAVTQIRGRGYDLALNDYCVGLGALGVPVLDRRGGFVGAISVTSGTADFDSSERVQAVLAATRESAAAVGIRLEPPNDPAALSPR